MSTVKAFAFRLVETVRERARKTVEGVTNILQRKILQTHNFIVEAQECTGLCQAVLK
jgi:hypothetical protein